jgi:hypothetical protein
MKLIYQSSQRSDIESARLLLESRGIPVYVSNEDTNRNLSYMSIALKLGIWVVFEDQYDDAIALLTDDTYEVKKPRNVEEYYSTLKKVQCDAVKSSFDSSMLILVSLFIIGFLIYFILKVTSA